MIKSFLDKLLGNSPQEEIDTSSHIEKLEALKKNHSFIDVKCPRTGHSYQSMILAIDIEEDYLVIDELFPNEGVDDILEGDTLQITSQTKTQPVHFISKLLARETREGNPAYRIELPDELGVNQNRNAFRVYVDREEDLHISLNDIAGNTLAAHIVNLSAEGIKLSFDEDVSGAIQEHFLLEDCTLHLPTGFDVHCEIEIRNSYLMRTPNKHTLAGGKLFVPSPPERSKLDQYLISVQRKQRRRQMQSLGG